MDRVATCVATATIWNPKAQIGQNRLLISAKMSSASKHPASTANNPNEVPAQLGFICTAAALNIVAKINMADPI
jgi:hypothetical protein